MTAILLHQWCNMIKLAFLPAFFASLSGWRLRDTALRLNTPFKRVRRLCDGN